MKKYIQLLRSSRLFNAIEEDDIEKMLCCLTSVRKEYNKDEFIMHQGESISSMGIVLEGTVLVIQEDIWGNRNIVSRLIPAETFGAAYALAPSSILNVSVLSESPSSILFLDMKRMLNLCSNVCEYHSRLVKNLIGELAEKNLSFSEKLRHITQRSTREKLLSYLSSEAQKKGKYEFDIPFSRQQLADYLGVDRSGLSSEMSEMQKEGLIEYHRSHFRLMLKE